MGKLYLIEQTSGSDEQMTLRVRRVLQEATAIFAQHALAARQMLAACPITASLKEPDNAQEIVEALEGGDVGWIVPTLELPPAWLQSLIGHGIEPVPLPGPVDEITALVMSGLPADRFVCLGRLPASPRERRTALQRVRCEPHTLLFTALGQDLPDVLDDLCAILGERRAAIDRAGSTWRGPLSQAPVDLDGLLVLVIEGAETPAEAWTKERVGQSLRQRLQEGVSRRDAVQEISARSGWPRRQVYAMAAKMAQDR